MDEVCKVNKKGVWVLSEVISVALVAVTLFAVIFPLALIIDAVRGAVNLTVVFLPSIPPPSNLLALIMLAVILPDDVKLAFDTSIWIFGTDAGVKVDPLNIVSIPALPVKLILFAALATSHPTLEVSGRMIFVLYRSPLELMSADEVIAMSTLWYEVYISFQLLAKLVFFPWAITWERDGVVVEISTLNVLPSPLVKVKFGLE